MPTSLGDHMKGEEKGRRSNVEDGATWWGPMEVHQCPCTHYAKGSIKGGKKSGEGTRGRGNRAGRNGPGEKVTKKLMGEDPGGEKGKRNPEALDRQTLSFVDRR